MSSTDETGNTASENKVHLHATTLHLPGMDHARLTCRYGGRDFRLTAVLGDVVTGMVS